MLPESALAAVLPHPRPVVPTTAIPTPGDRRRVEPALAALLRVHLTYLWRHRRPLSLEAPRRFTELVQRRKLTDRDPRLPQLIDKLAVKRFVTETLGAAWVTPTWWSGEALPAEPPSRAPFVLKSRHGCNQRRFFWSDAGDWAEARRAARGWMQRPYCRWLDEWGYRDVPRGLLIEPYLGDGATLPIDYKLYVFHGRVEAVQVHLDRATDHRWLLFDRSWRRLSAPSFDPDPIAPAALAHMIAGAEALGQGFDFVRVDFYDIGDVPRFGEMTFYPGSGLDPFDPPAIDLLFGSYWLASDRVVPASRPRSP